jgi:hypothetical protein
VPFLVASLIAGALLLYLGRTLTFYYDEWRSITFDGTALDYLRPVNEHWSTIPLALYRSTFSVVGLQSYLPYLAQVIALHLITCAGAYVLMRRRVGRPAATVLALPLLFLGAGSENLFWAFQTGFVGSVAFGLWALVVVEMPGRRNAVASSVLLVAALMSSGIGLFFLVGLVARTAVDRGLRARSLVAAPGALAYLTWHAVLGHDAVGGDLGGPASATWFAVRGVGYAVQAMVDVQDPALRAVGVAAVAVLATIAVRRSLRGRKHGLAIGCLVGLVSMYLLIGVARAEHPSPLDFATSGRYVYVAAFFLVVCVADLATGVAFRRPRTRIGRVAAVVAGVAIAWIVVVNMNSLRTGMRTELKHQADLTRAFVELAVEHEGEPWLDPEARLGLMPPAREIPGLVREHGSPVEDAYFPSVVQTPSADAYADARRALSRD